MYKRLSTLAFMATLLGTVLASQCAAWQEDPAEDGERTVYQAIYILTCNGESGEVWSDPNEDPDEAKEQARIRCEQQRAYCMGTSSCLFDRFEPPLTVKKAMASGVSCRMSCVADDGQPLAANRTRGTEAAAADAAWQALEQQAAPHGGVAPGTVRTEFNAPMFNLCYRRVKFVKDDVVVDYEVEGKGRSEPEARKAAEQAATRLKSTMGGGWTTVTEHVGRCLMLPIRWKCHATALCVHQCHTTDGTVLTVGRYGPNQVVACAAVRGAADVLADGHGGVTSCTNVTP